MNPKRLIQYALAAGIILLSLVVIGAFFLPWKFINWGTFAWKPAATVTVIGEAKTEEQNKKATFTAGISIIKDKKDDATGEVQTKMTAIIDAVKQFGIKAENIQTQNLSINQEEETYVEGGKQKRRPGQWRANNSIEITLDDVGKAGALTEMLSKTGANNIYGPNFTLGTNPDENNALLTKAVDDARKKAELLAKAAGKHLGNILTVSEGTTTAPKLFEGAGIGGGAMEPGSQTVQKTVTVTFMLVDPSPWEGLMSKFKTNR